MKNVSNQVGGGLFHFGQLSDKEWSVHQVQTTKTYEVMKQGT